MALLASQCRNSVFWSRILPRASLVLSQRIPDRKVAVRSEKFPDYSLIYDFDKIRAASRFNRTKYQATVLTAVGIPTVFAVQQLTGYISPHFVLSFTFFSCAFTVFLHSCGFLFNNVVGYIYVKDDDETVKISHVGYWGRRVDVELNIENIQTFSDAATRLDNPWYRKIRLNNSKNTYKLYHTAGKILDDKTFAVIFGDVK